MTSLKEIHEKSSNDEEHFMGEIATIGELSDDYTIELSLNNRHVTFKIDSGADVWFSTHENHGNFHCWRS